MTTIIDLCLLLLLVFFIRIYSETLLSLSTYFWAILFFETVKNLRDRGSLAPFHLPLDTLLTPERTSRMTRRELTQSSREPLAEFGCHLEELISAAFILGETPWLFPQMRSQSVVVAAFKCRSSQPCADLLNCGLLPYCRKEARRNWNCCLWVTRYSRLASWETLWCPLTRGRVFGRLTIEILPRSNEKLSPLSSAAVTV